MARISRKGLVNDNVVLAEQKHIYHAAAYVRLSIEDNHGTDNSDSIVMQQYMLEGYIARQPDMELYQVYCDNGESGTDFQRPGFVHMMEDVKRQKVDCIVVKDLSRFGRNYVEAGYYLEKVFPFLGIRFVAVNDEYDSEKDQEKDELVLSLKNLVNDLYAKDISQKIHAALFIKQKKGEYIGALPPYGYLKSTEDKHKLVVDPETACIVQNIFQWRLAGDSFTEIARKLNNREIVSPSLYHYQKGHKKKKPTSFIWQAQTIKHITTNPVYAGHMAQGKTKKSLCDAILASKVSREHWIVVENTHEALVSQEVFDRVQNLAKI